MTDTSYNRSTGITDMEAIAWRFTWVPEIEIQSQAVLYPPNFLPPSRYILMPASKRTEAEELRVQAILTNSRMKKKMCFENSRTN